MKTKIVVVLAAVVVGVLAGLALVGCPTARTPKTPNDSTDDPAGQDTRDSAETGPRESEPGTETGIDEKPAT